jgi:hypothetical protein
VKGRQSNPPGRASPRAGADPLVLSRRSPKSLAIVFKSLDATARRHESAFQAARATDPALAPYPTATALLHALASKSKSPMAERQAVVPALVRLHQSTRHPLWQALLLRAFEPLLFGLRERERCTAGDRDQRILTAFLEALAFLRVEGRPVFLVVRDATLRVLLQKARSHDDKVETVPLEEVPSDPATREEDAAPFRACLANELGALIAGHKGGEDVVRVLAGVETIAEQVARLAGSEPSYREPITAECLYKRRHRAVHEVRVRVLRESKDRH